MIFGAVGRQLTFVDGQSNAEVLKHELEMLDVMTANRDQGDLGCCARRKEYSD